MNSPAEIPYKSFIEIERNSDTPIYLQLANQLTKAIQLGYIPSGTKLLGTRLLSEILTLHRNTIVNSFQELEAQGWIEIIPNKGSYVLSHSSQKFQKTIVPKQFSINLYPDKTGFQFEESILLDNPYENFNQRLYLTDGTIDHRLAELKLPAKLYSAILKRKTSISKVNQSKNDYFLKNLANYLNLTRGLHISKENILVTRSSEISLFLIAEILLKQNDVVAVSNLSYYKSNMIFQTQFAKIKQIKTDEFGIDTDDLRRLCEQLPIRIVYVTPHHHYQTTVTLSSQRRVELLQLSQEFGFAIVEDDYDFDFHYSNHPILPLASSDQNGMVIYTGKFGHYLAPGYRIGFIVAPKNLILEAKKHLSILDQQVDPFIEQVLGEMISEGEINRILKKHRKTYRERRDYFCQKLKTELNDLISFTNPNGGLAVWINFNQPINLMELKRNCAKNELFIPQTILYQTQHQTGIRLGFAHLNFEEIDEVVSILKQEITKKAE
ncbi:PLP-dependent aminotransferase family protein [Empedobacter sp.]|uniref:aminotransferase-like domain-containing protein n=1 Tax=Empedobacter sp. TaxID=1927715 RepID=UPI0028B25C71|nr:PLP-dependent aminotransferase family protein [Empedobacter sp.]